MTYVAGSGDVVAKRSLWRVSIVSDVFWGVVNFIGLLCVCVHNKYSSERGAPRRILHLLTHQLPSFMCVSLCVCLYAVVLFAYERLLGTNSASSIFSVRMVHTRPH